jgi:phospholipase C
MKYADDCVRVQGYLYCDMVTFGSKQFAGETMARWTASTSAVASQYVLADHMFPTEFGTSFTAHQDLIAGTTRISGGGGGSYYVEPDAIKFRMWRGWKNAIGNGLVVFSWQ